MADVEEPFELLVSVGDEAIRVRWELHRPMAFVGPPIPAAYGWVLMLEGLTRDATKNATVFLGDAPPWDQDRDAARWAAVLAPYVAPIVESYR
jgi:hypothetical protein